MVEYSWLDSCKSYNPELFVMLGAVQMSILQRCEAAAMINILHTKMKRVMRCRFSISDGNFAQNSS